MSGLTEEQEYFASRGYFGPCHTDFMADIPEPRQRKPRCFNCRKPADWQQWGDTLVCQHCGVEYLYAPVAPAGEGQPDNMR